MKRIIYFFYYLKITNLEQFLTFFQYVKRQKGISSLSLMADIVYSSFRYKVSILDYFFFRFFDLNKIKRKTYAGTGYMYEYQLAMNPKISRSSLENKIEFLNMYKQFIIRQYVTLSDLKIDITSAEKILNNHSGKMVLKLSTGQVGAEVSVEKCIGYSPLTLIEKMEREGFDLVEEFVVQHSELMRMSPSGLNTIRIFSQLDEKGEVVFLGGRLRLSIDSTVDNMAAGNLAAPIDMETGIVNGPGVYSDITKESATIHPVTRQIIPGFQIPFWRESVRMISQAAKFFPQNRSIGWDIAISEKGPELIEGNHNWCKLLWQLPVNQGLKHMIEPFRLQ